MILVTGGTGLVGSHLLYALLQSHEKVRATHRSSSDLNYVQKVFSFYTEHPEAYFKKIEWVEADITQIPALTKAFEGIRFVYHCAAYIHFDPKNYYPLKKTNIEGTANVVNISLANEVEKLCYVSSIATLSDVESDAPIDETNDWNPEADNSVYAITKYGGEMEVWRGIQEGLKAVIVNPGVILGEGHWHSGSGVIVRRASKGISYYTSGSSGFVDVVDVVNAMIKLMNSTIENERYVLVGDNLSFKKVIQLLAQNFNTQPPQKKLSRNLLLFLTKLDAISHVLFGTPRKLVKALVDSLYTQSHFDASKIEQDLNFSFTPIEKTIKRVVSNYTQS